MARPARRLALSSRWATLTASPLLPGVSPTISFPQVVVPTIPLTVRPFAVWNALTASTVAGEKEPSIADGIPCARRRPCTACTSTPRLPTLWVGNATVTAAAPGAVAASRRTTKAAGTKRRITYGTVGMLSGPVSQLHGGDRHGEADPRRHA